MAVIKLLSCVRLMTVTRAVIHVLLCSITQYFFIYCYFYLLVFNVYMDGWSGPSRGWMAAGSRHNLLPRQCLLFSDVAGVSCNRTLSFRPVDNPTGMRMHTEGAPSLSASPVLG